MYYFTFILDLLGVEMTVSQRLFQPSLRSSLSLHAHLFPVVNLPEVNSEPLLSGLACKCVSVWVSSRWRQSTCYPRSRWSSCTSPARSPGMSGTWPGGDIHWWTSPGTSQLPRSPSAEIRFVRCTSGSRRRNSPVCFWWIAPALKSERRDGGRG